MIIGATVALVIIAIAGKGFKRQASLVCSSRRQQPYFL